MTDSDDKEVFDIDRIRTLIELMRDHDIAEVDLEQGDQRIRLARGGQVVNYTAPPPAASVPQAPATPAPATAEAPSPGPPADGPNIAFIKSPGVGTFYSRPNPNAEAFVKIGDNVEPETTVCIIEAMKVFNEIQAEIRGKIVAILADDEEAVDFGKPLYKVDTSQ
ncbi:MAG TPA: acetyl-CoA carboxylase biotin carboxyl carrier protein [Planctomycetes bacterium]|nr:acetyl-CoA carboxylase biotin carboxyl carrier protein [Planctomycetota bacterium]